MIKTDEYGMNGKHEPIGARYTENQFKGRVLEWMRTHEMSHTKLEATVENNKKMVYYGMGGIGVILFAKQLGLW